MIPTNKNCKAGDIEKAEYGGPKENVGASIINFSVAYDMNNQIPLLYENYPGSIVDVSQLQYLIQKFQGYGYKKIGFVLDRGYFSKDNIRYMESCGYDFIIMVKGKASFAIKEYHTYGMTVRGKLYTDDEMESYFHLYHKTSRENAECTQLENLLQRMEEMMHWNQKRL